ncbi:MAG: PVC-type heme-binding CxxCH protein, partial [Verrucomicrobiota bacterium]
KRSKVDRWSRTTYDRIPEPPPRGPRGADRLTILEDIDGDGEMDRARDFVAGLNLGSGFAFGHGGVFVLQAPYLLFYPDRNRDDIPDADPAVCLEGFGMQDAHSVANSLTFGPDGWLYGCQGSTVTSHVSGIEFQQGVWRYHPLTHAFELFCEGGGNSWGLDFDAEGELIYSTNVGPYRMLHARQGAYYWKSFGKHGALHNPYAFGFFEHVPHTNFSGGHVTVGGLIYRGTNLPARFSGMHIAGDLLGHSVQWHRLFRSSSTFSSSHGGELLRANDTWFAPSDLALGPDNALYVADWHDQRTAHPDPDAAWDRSNGRIYRIAVRGSKFVPPPELHRRLSTELLTLLGNSNPWMVRETRRVLAERRDPEVILPLRTMVMQSETEPSALEALWALYISGGFSDAFAARALNHRFPMVRCWTVRLLGDERNASEFIAQRLIELAATESDVRVRAQLACSAARLATSTALSMAFELVRREADAVDPQLPLLLWWAIERHAIEGLTELTAFFSKPPDRLPRLAREVILESLLRRWSAQGMESTYNACAAVIAATERPDQARLWAAIETGLRDRPQGSVGFGDGGLFAKAAAPALPPTPMDRRRPVEQFTLALAEQFEASWTAGSSNVVLIRLACRMGRSDGLRRARALAGDNAAPEAVRMAMVECLAEFGDDSAADFLIELAMNDRSVSVRMATLNGLRFFSQAEIADRLIEGCAAFSAPLQERCFSVLLSRKDWARAVLNAVNRGSLPARIVPLDQLRVVALHEDSELDQLVRKHWGTIRRGTAEEQLAEMRRLNNDLRAGSGDAARGHALFSKLCASCHVLHGEGSAVGPDLTHANRADREFLLASLVDPSAVIRREFSSYDIETRDGRSLSGLLDATDGHRLTLVTSGGQRFEFSQAEIKTMRESELSLMPEGLLRDLKPQELRDLFRYLESPNALKP